MQKIYTKEMQTEELRSVNRIDDNDLCLHKEKPLQLQNTRSKKRRNGPW